MKKVSAASLISEWRLEGKVLFLDRCLGKTIVAERLRAEGLVVVTHFEQFPQTEYDAEVDDTVWLREVGGRGWVILSKDQHLDRNQIELVALLESGAPCFVLTAGSVTGDEMAASFLRAMPSIGKFLEKFPAPFVARVTAAGHVQMHLTQSGLIKRVR